MIHPLRRTAVASVSHVKAALRLWTPVTCSRSLRAVSVEDVQWMALPPAAIST